MVVVTIMVQILGFALLGFFLNFLKGIISVAALVIIFVKSLVRESMSVPLLSGRRKTLSICSVVSLQLRTLIKSPL